MWPHGISQEIVMFSHYGENFRFCIIIFYFLVDMYCVAAGVVRRRTLVLRSISAPSTMGRQGRAILGKLTFLEFFSYSLEKKC
jgi:hypothetical protein